MLSVSARLHVLSLSPAISLCACVQADRFHQACDAIVNTVVLRSLIPYTSDLQRIPKH